MQNTELKLIMKIVMDSDGNLTKKLYSMTNNNFENITGTTIEVAEQCNKETLAKLANGNCRYLEYDRKSGEMVATTYEKLVIEMLKREGKTLGL